MEKLDVYDENNNFLEYSLDREEIHNKNLFHRHVSAWIMNLEGKVLMQQRAFSKKKNPGRWSKTGGHVDAGETPNEGIKRELFEEIGLEIPLENIKYYEIFKSKSKENYFSYGYIFITNWKEDEFKLQKEEVERVKYYTIEELEKIKEDNNQDFVFCNWPEEDFKRQIKILKEYRSNLK